jgi:hypothetical protein
MRVPVTDSRHTLAKISAGVTEAHAFEIETELAGTVDTPADTAAEYYPIVRPVLAFFADSLPADSNWKKALENYLTLADAEQTATDTAAAKTAAKTAKSADKKIK